MVRFLLIYFFPITIMFLLISAATFAQDKIYTCKPVAAAVVMESGQMYHESLETMDEEAGLLSVVPESQFLISKEEGFLYKNNPNRDFESLITLENIGFHKEIIEVEKISKRIDEVLNIKNLKVFYKNFFEKK